MNSSAGGIQITTLDPAGYRYMPWKNGGGVTVDIAVTMLPGFAAGSWEGIVWRFSRTAIVTPGAFSDLSGYDRQLALVSGEGLVLGTPVFGVAIGIATTAAYTAASSVMPANARGAGFGLLTTASLAGLALSPIVNGILGATSIRAVFLLDTVVLIALAFAVSRLMIAAPLLDATAPATEEL